jgi:hypothetical protein
MTNTNNLKLAKNVSRYASIGFGLWLLFCFCCFSSSASSMVSIIKSLQSLPGEVVEYGDAVNENVAEVLKNNKKLYVKLYRECEDADYIQGITANLDDMSEGDEGEIKTESGIHIKKIEMNNVSFDLTGIFVYEDGHEEKTKIDIGNVNDYTWTIGCTSQDNLAQVEHEVHGKIMYLKDIKLKWKPSLKTEEPRVEGYSIKK